MMASQSQMHEAGTAQREKMPAAVRFGVFGVVGLLFAGALYLIAVRGQALLVDLSALSQRIFCF
jgi:hypothetical protein